MNNTRTAFVVVGIACAAFVSAAQQPNGSIVVTGKTAVVYSPPGVFPTAMFSPVEGEQAAVTKELTQKITELLARKDFGALDATADNLRKSKAQAANGTWHLSLFYNILTELPSAATDLVWSARIDLLNEWIKVKPNSITARVALANCYISYAWHARGGGLASTVTTEGWRLFKERGQLAKKTLHAANTLEAQCPGWWDVMQFVALNEGWNLVDYEKLFQDAVAFEPARVSYYKHKVQFLLPRWFGKEGDWQKFAAQTADETGGEAGDILYARIGWGVHQRGYYGGFLRDSGYSWPRMKKGLEAIIKQYPNSLTAVNELAYLAFQAKDRTCAKPLFEHIGTNVDKEIWRDDIARFVRARTWALAE